jgi:acetylornithine/succinyldiaminopimelate/putrescine aminotransferase
MQALEKLNSIRSRSGKRQTQGLSDAVVKEFLTLDPKLGQAIDDAHTQFAELERHHASDLKQDEAALIETLQHGYVNFYPKDQTNPYIPLAAKGPWIVTSHGAVVHDSGGYGMLGLGHSPDNVIAAMAKPHVMANIMTANFSQKKLYDLLMKEVGHNRKDKPFVDFLCMNSGSESVTVATRISDIHAKKMTDQGGPHAGKKIKYLVFKDGFHGRTERPAQASDSSLKKYEVLASFRGQQFTYKITPNSIEELHQAYEWAKKENVYFEMAFVEPVMGEGNPGMAMTRQFYDAMREITRKNDTLLLVDSIQAGLRATGNLSLCDYPGFEDCLPPDMETYSKAINAGQYPLSILALTHPTAEMYVRGVYGNTMTTNPRALEVACEVLKSITPEIRKNIVDRGREFLEKLSALKKEFPDIVGAVQGTGLLCSIELNAKTHPVVGHNQIEEYLRMRGIGIIHGGKNALRLTPHFQITSREADLVVGAIRDALKNGLR